MLLLVFTLHAVFVLSSWSRHIEYYSHALLSTQLFWSFQSVAKSFLISGSLYWFAAGDISCSWGMGRGCPDGWRECNDIDSLCLPCNCPVLARASAASGGGRQSPTAWWCTQLIPRCWGLCKSDCLRYIWVFVRRFSIKVLLNIWNSMKWVLILRSCGFLRPKMPMAFWGQSM
jgi:hypothetical protein